LELETLLLLSHWYGVYFSTLPERILQSLQSSATLTRPKAKYNLGKIHEVTVSRRIGSLALGELQFDDPSDLLEQRLNPLGLFETRVGNYSPTSLTVFQKPFEGPLVDAVCGSNEPGSPLREKWRQVLFEQHARRLAIDIARTSNHY